MKIERQDTRLQLSIYNLADISPRTTTNMNLAAADVVLDPNDLASIDEVFPADQSFGDRYPDMSSIGSTTPRA